MRSAISSIEQLSGSSRIVSRTISFSVIRPLSVACGDLYKTIAPRSDPAAQPSPTVASEIPKGAKVITGYFANFQSGDYLHAGIRKANGEIVYFFLGKPGLEYFLVTHKEQKLDLFYETVNTYIPESAGKERIRQLVGGKAGDLKNESWWKQIQNDPARTRLKQQYAKLVAQATVEQ